jgi:RND family efflux transporter MFP subunit
MRKIDRTAFNHKLVALSVVAVMTGCAGSGTVGSNESSATNLNSTISPSPTLVSVAAVQPSTTDGDLLIPASISVENIAIVLAQRDGTIIQLRGQEGGRVAKGAILAQFNNDEQRSQLRQAELEIARLKVEEEQYESLVKLNRNELEREKLLAKDGVSSQRDVERAQYKFDQGVHEYEKTRLATQAAHSRLEALKIEIEKSTVRAPVGGVIMRRHVNLGSGVAKNDKLFEISQLSPLEVKFQLPQTEKVRLAPGQIVMLSPPDSEQVIARAQIRRLDPMADASNNTVGYVAQLIGSTGLMPGLGVNVRVPRAAVGSAVYVPRTAFPAGANLHQGAVSSLLVVEGDVCADRIVAVSEVDGERVEVISGLNAGDEVIVAPPAHLKAGDRIEIGGRL